MQKKTAMLLLRRLIVAALIGVVSAGTLSAFASGTGTDPAKCYAWGENVGWANAAPAGHGVTVHFNGTSGWLGGYAWGENIGWICFPTNGNGGVTLDASGALSGYAWGKNVGWIAFPTNGNGGVSINMASGAFSGEAWGENIGWIRFRGGDPAYGVRTLAFDTQALGTPNWWLDRYGLSFEEADEGDQVPAWQEFAADTDPTSAASYFQVLSVSTTGSAVEVVAWPTSERRSYTLQQTEHPASGVWSNVAGAVSIQGAGGEQTLEDTEAGARVWRSYRVEVSISPGM